MNTSFQDIYERFESSFQDKHIIPEELEKIWLLKAIDRYSVEVKDLSYDESLDEFTTELDRGVSNVIAAYMRQYYQEREVSKVNKRISIVTSQLSVDGNNGSKTAAKNELEYHTNRSETMTEHMKQTAYV